MLAIERYQAAQQKLIDVIESKDFEKKLKTNQVFSKSKGNLLKVKYYDGCKFRHDWTFACRGTTFDTKDGKVVKAVYSLSKFFNYRDLSKNEPLYKVDIKNGEWFRDQEMTLVATIKHDGSNVQFFYDSEGTLHAYTLGTLEVFKIGSSNLSFYDATKRALSEHKDLDDYLRKHPYESCVAELVTKWNPIITKYSFEKKDIHLYPLVLIQDGLPRWDLLSQIESWKDGIPLHAEVVKGDLATHLSEMEKKLRSKPEVFGELPEGLVVYAVYNGVALPFCKYKLEEYLQASLAKIGVSPEKALLQLQIDSLSGNEIGECTQEQLQYLARMKRGIDEIVAVIPAETIKKKFVMKVKEIRRLDKVSSEILKNFSTIEKGDLESWILASLPSLQSRHGHEWFI